MKILKIENNKIGPAVAYCGHNVKQNESNENTYSYYIKHGSFGKDLWAMKIYLHRKSFPPTKPGDTLILDKDDYNLSAIRKSTQDSKRKSPAYLKDRNDNNIYLISQAPEYKLDDTIIVLWNIPLRNLTNIKYKLHGGATSIGEGINGKTRIDKRMKAPAPLIEVYDDCILEWTGQDPVTGTLFKQNIKFVKNSDTWTSEDLHTVTEKGENDDN